jgi:formylglycine-generating enzyme required for sulfatase activity
MQRNYGSLGQRRNSGSAWQWMIIGMVLGFGCAAIIAIGGIAAGVLSLDGSIAGLPTSTPMIITATPLPATATFTPTPITPTATQNISLQVSLPTSTPTTDPASLLPTAAPTTQIPPTVGGAALPTTTTGGGAVPPAVGGTGATSSDRLLALASEMVQIEGGTFQMGTDAAEVVRAVNECLAGYGGEAGRCQVEMGEDSAPPHSVTLSPFMIEVTEVSYEQYLAFINGLGPGSHRNGCGGFPCMQTRTDSETSNVTFDSANYSVLPGILNHPMTNVTWYGAQAYCEAIGRRLPTEAEWERAARGDTGFIYPWGDAWDATRANSSRPADLAAERGKVPVDALPTGASVYGVLNMAGNVAEWVSDWYDARWYSNPSSGGTDPVGPAAGTVKVARGGSWDTVPFFLRSVHRLDRDPLAPTADIGFRCAGDVGSQAPASNAGVPEQPNNLLSVTSTPDPATLGGSEEETTANSQPTLPPLPATNTPAAPAAPLATATQQQPLAPG